MDESKTTGAWLQDGLGQKMPKYIEVPSDEANSESLVVAAKPIPPSPRPSQGGGQLDGMPVWAKVGATLSAISIISGLLVYLVVNQVHAQNSASETFERLIDKFDRVIEKHDERQQQWMTRHGDKITSENEKTRAVIAANADKNSVSLEAVVTVLKQIRDDKK